MSDNGTTKNMPPIIFFGTEDFSLISLQHLINNGFPIAAVVTKPDMKKGRGKSVTVPPVKELAQKHNIPVWQPMKLSELVNGITALQPVVGVLVSFGRIIPQDIIDLFTPGIINVHPSLLPLYRGPSPIETTILNSDSETGVSIMQLSAKMDAGPLYVQKKVDLEHYRTLTILNKENLYRSLGLLGAEMLAQALPGIVSGAVKPTPQDESKATYCAIIKKEDGVIDWQKPASDIYTEVIAYSGWPGSRTSLAGIDVTITEGTSAYPVTKESDKPGTIFIDKSQLKPTELIHSGDYPLLYVVAGKDDKGLQTYYDIHRLKPAGKKEMSDREFINGYGHLLNDFYI
jgi:methionyl-tRNA formyltransferase